MIFPLFYVASFSEYFDEQPCNYHFVASDSTLPSFYTLSDEKVTSEQQAKEEKEQAENIATMLMRNYDAKLYGEDDTSQPTSRTTPVIPMEATRKKKKRKR